ncbi:MAG TPA: hypothetical protein VMN56_05675 [Casimicrobiaceae bacterium]|nr:hypothetical protein [Casimicrobiaceae bacterium]
MSPRNPDVPRDEFEGETTAVRELRTHDARIQRLELRDANMFGVDADDGMWQRHRKEHDAMKVDLQILNGFRAKALLIITLGGTLLGAITGIAAVIVEKALGH